MSVCIVLAPESASVPRARRFVAEELSDLSAETVDVARLLVSEVVTNAVLHAGTEVVLTLDRDDSTVQVQIKDTNPSFPVMRSHSPEAGTGRGLHVLDRLATRWGTSPVHGGKVVWFEIPTTAGVESGAQTVAGAGEVAGARAGELDSPDGSDVAGLDSGASADGYGDDTKIDAATDAGEHSGGLRDPRPPRSRDEGSESDDLIKFRWVALPLAQMDRTAEHYDAVLREFYLVLEREPTARATVPGRLIALMDELTKFAPLISSVEQDLERARRSGMASIDVHLDLPTEIGPLALRLDNLLDETDAYCGAGIELLSLEPTSEVVALRKWLIGELVRQAEGHPAVKWTDSPWATSPPRRRGRV
jgi:anti-sigma regulatory factor (Ser/Thr protein kinase)